MRRLRMRKAPWQAEGEKAPIHYYSRSKPETQFRSRTRVWETLLILSCVSVLYVCLGADITTFSSHIDRIIP